ncbi:TonB-dependent receptor domain-containing protein [Pedobacter nyackensis]|uniref:TonB-dependent receptor domain-containing protein n=1 Tax=Pedobacter nyackensis TaxID=475255 RepID=UPI0029302BB4|nr:TonB-dependent receptor [Pedobacter nyackensis]
MLNSKTTVIVLLAVLMNIVFGTLLIAQTKKTVSGVVKDSTDVGIPSAHVRLVSGKDTLNTSADNDGRFSFSGISFNTFNIQVRGIGYKAHSSSHAFGDQQVELQLAPVILKSETTMLNEVVIQGKITPIRVMKDTIEYNAGAYVVRENDRVEDLLKQLPGMEVDQDGKVTTMGKEMTKIRVNGKDFFTGNVTEFIKQLPADMVSHLQVIDDYGDEANFTGIKVGEPAKILNLVTKPGRNRGKFGNVSGGAGTNRRYGLNAALNLWNGDQQIGANSNLNNTNNSAGVNQSIGAGASLRRPISKNLTLNGGYNYNQNTSENEMNSYVETLNELGTIYSDNHNRSNQKGGNNSFNLGLNSRLRDDFLNLSVNGSLSNNSFTNNSSSRQTGVIRQDLITESGNSNRNPNISTNVSWGKKFGKKKKRMLMMNFSGGLNKTINEEDILTRTGYYDKVTNELVKDSLLNRLVDTRNGNNNFSVGINFSEPLTKATDTVKRTSIDLSYMTSVTSTNNSLQTNVINEGGEKSYVDSLSNTYTSLFINHNLNLNYRYSAKKLEYGIGMSFQPSTLTGSYEGRADKISQTTTNMSPMANARFVFNKSQSINLNYSGSSNAPSFEQLQPVPDTRNLQNVIIGNPDLKTSFAHSVNIGYRVFGSTTGRALQIGLNGNTTQNQVVSNVRLIPDTLNGFKQETRYENANGNYRVGSNYSLSLPFAKRKYTLSVNGNISYANNVLFTDNAKNFNTALNFNQSLRASMNTQKVSMETGVTYSYNGNEYSLATSNTRNIENWSFMMQSRVRPVKFLSMNVNASKTINNGYALNASNPLLVGASVETLFLKNQIASLTLQVNDLLNQGNTFNRVVTNNSIIDSRSNQVTRFLSMNFSMRLQNFGGKKKS